MQQEAVIMHPVVDVVRKLVEEERAWIQKCIDTKNALDGDEQVEFQEIFKVMTETPYSERDVEFIVTIGDTDTLDEAYQLHQLRQKWAPYLHSSELPNEVE